MGLKIMKLFASNGVTSTQATAAQATAPEVKAAEAAKPAKQPHRLTDEQRAKGRAKSAETRARKAEERKAAKAAERESKQAARAAKQAAKADPMRWFKNEVHAKFNYYTRLMSTEVFELTTVPCEDVFTYAAKLQGKLAGLVMVPVEGHAYALVLKHRATEGIIQIFASPKGTLTFTTSLPQDRIGEVADDLDLLAPDAILSTPSKVS